MTDGRTHHGSCWRVHLGCAVEMVKQLRAECDLASSVIDVAKSRYDRAESQLAAEKAKRREYGELGFEAGRELPEGVSETEIRQRLDAIEREVFGEES